MVPNLHTCRLKLYSLIQSAKANGLEIYIYFCKIFCGLASDKSLGIEAARLVPTIALVVRKKFSFALAEQVPSSISFRLPIEKRRQLTFVNYQEK
jgi:hypothetical protein